MCQRKKEKVEMMKGSYSRGSDLVIALSKAIHMIRFDEVDPSRFNDELKDMYSWSNVAERTEKVKFSHGAEPKPVG